MSLQLSRKLSNACIIFLLVVLTGAGAAAQNPIDSCKSAPIIKAGAFIAGVKDTLLSTGNKVKSIWPIYIVNGFRLRLADTSLRVVQFRLGFYNHQAGYFEQQVYGDSLEPAKLTIASRDVVLGASMFLIEKIGLSRHDSCYWANPISYYTPNRLPNDPPRRISSSPHTH